MMDRRVRNPEAGDEHEDLLISLAHCWYTAATNVGNVSPGEPGSPGGSGTLSSQEVYRIGMCMSLFLLTQRGHSYSFSISTGVSAPLIDEADTIHSPSAEFSSDEYQCRHGTASNGGLRGQTANAPGGPRRTGCASSACTGLRVTQVYSAASREAR